MALQIVTRGFSPPNPGSTKWLPTRGYGAFGVVYTHTLVKGTPSSAELNAPTFAGGELNPPTLSGAELNPPSFSGDIY